VVWEILRALLAVLIGGTIPLLLTFLSTRRDRARRMHDLYAEFLAATYIAYARWPEVIAAARAQKAPPASGMLELQHAGVRVMMVEKDRARLRLIDEILEAAETMHSTPLAMGDARDSDGDDLARRRQSWSKLLEKRDELIRLLRGLLG
jgi:hypothetical protein